MADKIVRATAANAQIRAFAAYTKDTVEAARKAHDLSPVVSAALGRLLTGGAMMGIMMKGEKDILTIQVNGDGPLKGMTVTADSSGHVKGYANDAQVMLPPSRAGKLDVGGAVGKGTLRVIKDMGLKEPYIGQTDLQTGEIAEDLTYYFAISEQVPSAVGLGVLMDKENTVRHAGGFIIQLMPFAEEAVIARLEKVLTEMPPVTGLLSQDQSPEALLQSLLGDMDLLITDTIDTGFVCNCDQARVEKALISIGKKELAEMIADGETIEVKCHFCNTAYRFTTSQQQDILHKASL